MAHGAFGGIRSHTPSYACTRVMRVVKLHVYPTIANGAWQVGTVYRDSLCSRTRHFSVFIADQDRMNARGLPTPGLERVI